jgi:dihydroorotate dehydrogenase electron transfer subunit
VHNPTDAEDAVPHSIFAAGLAETQASTGGQIEFNIAGSLPASWEPGTQLLARGPLGRGFRVPRSVRRMALAAIGGGPGRLLPVLAEAPAAEVALFCDEPVAELPLRVEQQGLDALPGVLAWADYLVIDNSLDELDELPRLLGLRQPLPRNLEAQALVRAAMPCGGLAECGVCTLPTNRGNRLVCEDGPVFDLSELV